MRMLRMFCEIIEGLEELERHGLVQERKKRGVGVGAGGGCGGGGGGGGFCYQRTPRPGGGGGGGNEADAAPDNQMLTLTSMDPSQLQGQLLKSHRIQHVNICGEHLSPVILATLSTC